MKDGILFVFPKGNPFKAHRCHNCGGKLTQKYSTRTITPDNPEYDSRVSFGERFRYPKRNITVTDRFYICKDCGADISYDDQVLVEYVQKSAMRHRLSDEEITRELEDAKRWKKKRDRIIKLVKNVIWLAFILFVLLNGGKIGFRFYF